MARRSRQGHRPVIDKWRGLNQRIPPSALPPGALSLALNVETHGGALRPRGGYREFNRSGADPNGKVLSIYGHPIGADQADILLVQALRTSAISDFYAMNDAGTDWIALTARSSSPSFDWAVSDLSNQPVGATNPILKIGRATYFTAGGWTLVMMPDSPVMAFKKSGSNYLFRRAGYAYPPTTPSNATPNLSPDREGPSVSGASNNAGGGVTSSATYKYLFTWAEDVYSQLESNLGTLAVSVTTGGSDNRIVLTLGTGAVANGKDWPEHYFGSGGNNETMLFAGILRVYRTQADGDEYFHLADLAYGATSLIDTTSDVTLSAGSPPPTLRDAPPENILCGCYARNRAFYVPANSNVVWYSRADLADTGRAGVEYVGPFNFFTIPTDDPITGCVAYGQDVLIFKKNSVWMVDTSPLGDDGSSSPPPNIYQLENAGGACSPHVIATSLPRGSTVPRVFYANVNGGYQFAGQTARCITEDIPADWSLLAPASWSNASGAWDPFHHRYVLAAQHETEVGGGTLKRILVYDDDTESWFPWVVPTDVRSLAVVQRGPSTAAFPNHPLFYHGGADGKIYYWSKPGDEYYSDNGTAIDWYANTGRMGLGDVTQRKRLLDLAVGIEAGTTAAVTLTLFVDDDIVPAKTASYTVGASDRLLMMHLGGKARKYLVRLSGASVPAMLRILSISMPQGQRGIRG